MIPRVGFLGPEGTNTHEALLGVARDGIEPVPLPTIFDTVMAVHEGTVDLGLVPIENSLEGSVNATLDTLAIGTDSVAIRGELIHPIRTCLISAGAIELSDVEGILTHPQAGAQCARFIRTHLPGVPVLAASSTAEAIRSLGDHPRWAALGSRLAAERYGCYVLRAGVDDTPDNETRFVWLSASRSSVAVPGATERGPWKTAVVFWGVGAEEPGWLVGCLGEFASRDVNLTRIESRPRKQGFGRYMFFVDLEGRESESHVREALEALAGRVEQLRVLGSFPAA